MSRADWRQQAERDWSFLSEFFRKLHTFRNKVTVMIWVCI